VSSRKWKYGLEEYLRAREATRTWMPWCQRSFSSDAIGPGTNPNYPAIPIANLFARCGGKAVPASSAHRISASVIYTGRKWSGGVQRGVREPQRRLPPILGGDDVNRREHVAVCRNRNRIFPTRNRPWVTSVASLENDGLHPARQSEPASKSDRSGIRRCLLISGQERRFTLSLGKKQKTAKEPGYKNRAS